MIRKLKFFFISIIIRLEMEKIGEINGKDF